MTNQSKVFNVSCPQEIRIKQNKKKMFFNKTEVEVEDDEEVKVKKNPIIKKIYHPEEIKIQNKIMC